MTDLIQAEKFSIASDFTKAPGANTKKRDTLRQTNTITWVEGHQCRRKIIEDKKGYGCPHKFRIDEIDKECTSNLCDGSIAKGKFIHDSFQNPMPTSIKYQAC